MWLLSKRYPVATGAMKKAMAIKCASAPKMTKICQTSWKPNFPGQKFMNLVMYTTAPSV